MASAGFTPPRNTARAHGSSLRELGAPLDQERAASMADEGGMAGAVTDAVAQEARLLQRDGSQALGCATRAGTLQRVWPWALLFGGVALAAAAWPAVRGWSSRRNAWW